MISEWNVKKFCNGDITKIENYDKAIADTTQTWHCHHRLETHNSDGERRKVQLSQKELIALDMFYNRPPEELIFFTKSEHTSIHKTGLNGEKNYFYGKHHSEETRKKLHDKFVGKPFPKDASKNCKGSKWYNNGSINKRFHKGDNIPSGFVEGRINVTWKTYFSYGKRDENGYCIKADK